jgi:plasmid maintenance system antidote protein VapI
MVRRLPGEGSSSSQEQPSEEESFQPEYHQIKKMGLKPSKKKLRVGGWSSKENAVYLEFMRNNISDFTTEKARRTTKVFFRLSKILKKRTPDQCRSHHQKLQMKHKDDIYEIMNEVQIKINKTIA